MRRQSWLVLVLLMALPALAFGQAQTTGRITGRVTDDQGAPVAGATVTVNNNELQLERTSTTGPNGDFLFALLPTGPYSATVSAEGRQPQVLTFRLGIGETVPLNVTLSPGDVIAEEITVTGTATALETTSIGENFDYEEQVEQLPIPDRDIEDVAALSPNISFGPTGGTLSIAGAPSFDTTVLLDGAEVSDPYFGTAPTVYIEDAIEEVQVLTSGVSARYGRFQGGVINAITKSGSNDFEGTARVELEKETWNSQTPFEEDQDDTLNRVYQATLGGYILRDRLWFFVG
ncbi:MAG TPA: TonB-dependent receptor, partial [Thermoanaerobaculia bacterium]|nr:TonB-dependent receptor [Thermoanaerobaculia bacterium]